MTRDIVSLTAVAKVVVDAWDLDPKCVPIPWRTERSKETHSQPLVIAVIRDDGVVKCRPPISRLLEEVVTKLELASHIRVTAAKTSTSTSASHSIPHIESLAKPISVYVYWQLTKRKVASQKRYLDLCIGILLTPFATRHCSAREVQVKVFNFVDYPAVVLPTGYVRTRKA
ncbi:hypothetical protein BDW02DRAFT_642013 [Decorospora gaudefroyi]|uniref:Amidase domain-containing protein n=1 Tax=Decorospora gaudefroyi TaxID=184978 RepID=A0A6A5K100_9PLEO|nr:hypothetical protein BDW02DRAFT_642013 [Decorospora gaudefroyi]